MKSDSSYLHGILPFLIALTVCCPQADGNAVSAPRCYRVDSRTGDDGQDGTSARRAWRTLERVSRCRLQPGDVVLFARGSLFDGCLTVDASGSARKPIVLTCYGDERLPLPRFTNSDTLRGYGNCIRLRGDHIRVENLAFGPTLAGIPQRHRIASFPGMWQLGAILVDSSARHCVVRGNEFTDCGVGIKSNGAHTLIAGNYLHDCRRVLKRWNWGPIAIWLGADHQQVCYNIILNYRAEHPAIVWKTTGEQGADGGAIEIDDGRVPKHDISIHHNFSQGNQGFLEVTCKDVVSSPDYTGIHLYDNISDDFQSFVLMWQGCGCLIEHNTIVRRRLNGNEQGVFRFMQSRSENIVRKNVILTADSVVVFRNRADARTRIFRNLYCALSGRLRMGNEREAGKPLTAPLKALPAGYGARRTNRCRRFDALCDVSRLVGSDRIDTGMPSLPDAGPRPAAQ